jgi:putative Ca2+/H+ antiporter (TMEM165/GDT1 family)
LQGTSFYDPELAEKTLLEDPGSSGVLVDQTTQSSSLDQQGFMLSFLMIIVSEIGDKTFLIAAIMAMKHSRLVVFAGAFSSLFLMSVLSAFLGHVVPNLLPVEYTTWMAAILFLCFGIKMLSEAYHMKGDESQEEMAEVEEELLEAEDRNNLRKINAEEVGGMDATNEKKTEQFKDGVINLMQLVFSPVFVQTFILTFLGEWGDRSQISTIALAAANNVYTVTTGVVIGHSLCTFIAVMGGRYLATKISVKTGMHRRLWCQSATVLLFLTSFTSHICRSCALCHLWICLHVRGNSSSCWSIFVDDPTKAPVVIHQHIFFQDSLLVTRKHTRHHCLLL